MHAEDVENGGGESGRREGESENGICWDTYLLFGITSVLSI
jgi:hypothetical protein